LVEELNIPVMHDDQHGTAIISSAALLNALELAGKEVEHTKIVVLAGSAALACANLYVLLGINPDNIIMFDKDGVISSERNDLSALQKKYSKGKPGITLGDAQRC
jgi:malate dehydrogenase (oxaloacetate-decarboxylating)(NADP+)